MTESSRSQGLRVANLADCIAGRPEAEALEVAAALLTQPVRTIRVRQVLRVLCAPLVKMPLEVSADVYTLSLTLASLGRKWISPTTHSERRSDWHESCV